MTFFKHKQDKEAIYHKLKHYVQSFNDDLDGDIINDQCFYDPTVCRSKYIGSYFICYRCSHLWKKPKEISEISLEKSNILFPYTSEILFVQAIVWLKSIIMSAKTISINHVEESIHMLKGFNYDSVNDFQKKRSEINLNDNILVVDTPEVASVPLSQTIIPDSPNNQYRHTLKQMLQETDSAYDTLVNINNCDTLKMKNNRLHSYENLKSMLSPLKISKKKSKNLKCIITGIYNLKQKDLMSLKISNFKSPVNCNRTNKSRFINAIESNKLFSKKANSPVGYTKFMSPNKKMRKSNKLVSSEYINFLLQNSNMCDVALESVRMILNALKSEDIARQYIRWKRWTNTLEQEAVQAVLNFSDILSIGENNSLSNVCVIAIVQTIKIVFSEMLNKDELTKVSLWEYRICIILKLCDTATICIDILDFLFSEMSNLVKHLSKIYINCSYIPKMQLLVFATLALLKKLSVVTSVNHQENVTSLNDLGKTDLWSNKLLNHICIIQKVQNSILRKIEQWLTVLEKCTMCCLKYDPRFSDQSRKIIFMLTTI
ncbi:uncharacterized protein [Prorops nasuta]|uniref:uncharacterized protein isoform X2 n=1 Tax=Prorops nasuta TaxID=863751 RepID=UPI0034CF3CF1